MPVRGLHPGGVLHAGLGLRPWTCRTRLSGNGPLLESERAPVLNCGARRRAPRCRSSPGGPPGPSVIADRRSGPRPASSDQSRSSTCSGAGRQPPCDHPFRGPRHSTSGLPPPAEVLSERAASADRAASAGRGARGPRRRRSGPVPAPGLARTMVSHYARHCATGAHDELRRGWTPTVEPEPDHTGVGRLLPSWPLCLTRGDT